MSSPDYEILDLKDAPQFFDAVADRIWRAWWLPEGRVLSDVQSALADVVSSPGYPFSLVATRGSVFLGTVTSIQADIPARPHLGPCLAALWVEPASRGQGIGEALVEAVVQRLQAGDVERVYLSAKPLMREYYVHRGWSMIESDIDKDHQDVFVRVLPAV